jgi:hypothetical protein
MFPVFFKENQLLTCTFFSHTDSSATATTNITIPVISKKNDVGAKEGCACQMLVALATVAIVKLCSVLMVYA